MSSHLFATRATGAARDEQLGEHKTFHKASRWGHSRADTGRGAGRAWCRLARARETTRTGSTRHADRSINQFEHLCVERCPLTTRHTARRSGDSCGNECRTHSQTELRRDYSPEAEAETRRTRADECTIAGSRAEQSLTRGADRRLRNRPANKEESTAAPTRTSGR